MLSMTLKNDEERIFTPADTDNIKLGLSQYSTEDLARKFFYAYIGVMHPTYIFAPHNIAIATVLQKVVTGEIKRLIINMPPRHGKTMQTTELFPSYFMGKFPKWNVISTSYGFDLAKDSGRKVRNYMASEDYAEIFPESRLSQDSKSATNFSTVSGGGYIAAGVDGPIVGKGANLFIIDDPIKSRADANSETKRLSVKNFYKSVAYTRLAPEARIIIIMTRWHFDDLTGYLEGRPEDGEEWFRLSLKAIAEEDETEYVQRKIGEPLWKDYYPIETLQKIRRVIGTMEFNSQYQQVPIATEDATFDLEHFRRYPHSEISDFLASTRMNLQAPEHYKMPLGITRVVLSCDTSFQENAENSPSCLQAWGETKEGYKLIYRWSKKVKYYRVKKVIKNIWKAWSPYVNTIVMIENKASGQSLIQDLENDADTKDMVIIKYTPTVDKITRAQQAAAVVESGKVWIPDSVYWLSALETVIMQYPASKWKDDIDAMSQFLIWATKPKFRKGKRKNWR